VLVGHVDSATEGTGAFFRLATVPAGARVTVTVRGDRRLVYRVVGRELFAKSAVPLDTLFARTGAPRLTLITCGGPFDPAALSYRDNVVLTAVPVRP
jgi:sortase (surface protein transpeptidase)